MFAWLLVLTIGLVLSCSKGETDQEPEVKLSPSNFEVSVMSLGYDFAEIQWTASQISDKSKIVYDVYINEELSGENLEALNYRFEELEALTTYKLEVIAKSEYETQVVASYSLTTNDTPSPGAVSLKMEELSTDSIEVSWVNSDPTQNLTYSIYLDDVLQAENLAVNTYTFSDLEGNKLYQIKLIGTNEFNKSVETSLELKTDDYSEPDDFTLSVESVSLDGAKITWSQSESEELTYRVLLNSVEKANGLTVLEYEFKELDVNTRYTATIEAVNQYDKIKSKTIEFTTLEAEGPADFHIFVENLTHESALIRWETTGDNNEILSYKVFVNGFFKGEALNDNQLLLDRLEAGKLYQLKIEAKNAFNKTLEKTNEFTTLDAPKLSDFVISVGDIKQTSALLSWTESVASDGSKVTYDVYYPSGSIAKRGLEERQFLADRLHAGQTCEYKIEARSESVVGPLSKTVTFTTTEYEVPGDFKLNVEEITTSEAKVSWTSSELPSGGKLTYEVYLSGVPYSYDEAGNEFTFKNLKAGTDYTAKIVAKSENNTTNEQSISFSTEAEVEPEVKIDVVNVGTRLLELNWSLTGTDQYSRFELFLNGESVKIGNFKAYTFRELKSNTTYKIKVVAMRGQNTCEDEVEIKTQSYPEAFDFDMVITPKSFSQVEVDLTDFHEKNRDRFDDFSSMTYEAYLNGVKEDWGTGVVTRTLTKLNEQTPYDFQLIVRHADGSIALDKSTQFTTITNEAPVWLDEIEVKQVGFSFVKLSANLPVDRDDNIEKYTYYINDIAINDTYYTGNTRGNGQLERAINNNNDPILISHLKSNKKYRFYVIVSDTRGKSTKSNTVEFKTEVDAKSNFNIFAAVDKKLKMVGPRWKKMGAISSIKEIHINWVVDGVKLPRGQYIDPAKIEEMGKDHSLILDYSPFLIENPKASLSFSVLIEWIDQEVIRESESKVIVLQK